MSETPSPLIYVCVTCRRAGEPDAEPRPGALLADATEQAAAGTEVEVRRLRCLANCTRGPSAAMPAITLPDPTTLAGNTFLSVTPRMK